MKRFQRVITNVLVTGVVIAVVAFVNAGLRKEFNQNYLNVQNAKEYRVVEGGIEIILEDDSVYYLDVKEAK